MTTIDGHERDSAHILTELGLQTTVVGDEFHGDAVIVPEMFVPGTSNLRTSILAVWTDIVAGHAAVRAVAPAVPVTLDMDVHLYEEPEDLARVHVAARVLKAGQSVVSLGIDLTADGDRPLALAHASFMAAPDRTLTIAPEVAAGSSAPRGSMLCVPFAERAGCTRAAAGVAEIPRSDDGLNSSNTLNGGLLALAVEEAMLSLAPTGASLSSMALRYLRPVRIGPVVAVAELQGGLGRAEVRDTGQRDRLAVVATTRSFEP